MKGLRLVVLAAVAGLLVGCAKYSSEYTVIEKEESAWDEEDFVSFYRKKDEGFRFDAVELEKRHAEVFAKIDSEVQVELKDSPNRGRMGFIHSVWATKKRLLQDRYGIEWRSPSDLNPTVMFD